MLFSDTANLKLKAAFELYNDYYCETLPKEFQTISFSEVFEKKMQKLLTLQKKSYFYVINTAAKRVAILILALLVTLTASTFGVKAIGKAVKNFIVETFITHSDTVSSSDATTSEDETTSNVESSSPEVSAVTPSSNPSSEISSENITQTITGNLISSIVSDLPPEDSGYYKYNISSSITDYIAIGDTIYMLLKFPDSIMIIDANSGEVLKNESLESTPGEINLIGDDLWVSFPKLKQIRVYDKKNFAEKNRHDFGHEIHSFDVNNDYIIYTSNDHHCDIYRYNILSKEEKQITFYWYNKRGNKFTERNFYEPNIIINKESGVFYIAESSVSACILWCLDIETLEVKNYYRKDDYGYFNFTRQMYLLDGNIYWGAYKFDAADVSKVKCWYEPERYNGGGMLYVNKELVVTIEGLYLREDGTKILDFDIDESLVNAVITESGHLLYSDNKFTYIIPNISQTKTDSLPF